ncbi:MAG: CBP3 protein mitochondrial precursor [Rhodospirillaceae bacterium]|nr:MAG: CBP3 protein mitochondrial precursor [Rhodospirillaceae bacterium]
MIFPALFRQSPPDTTAQNLYALIVAQARLPVFYTHFGVADTVDGRFDMIVLHVVVLLHRLNKETGAATLAQALFDEMFGDMDRSLREMGVSDLRIGGTVKTMARAFQGRHAAYDAALESPDDQALEKALWRNVYRGRVPLEGAAALAGYVRAAAARLLPQTMDDFRAGRVLFGIPT